MNIAAKLRGMVTQSRKAADELSDGLESVRARIATLTDEREHIEVARSTLETALGRVDSFVQVLRRPLDTFYVAAFTAATDYRHPDLLRAPGEYALAASADLLGDALKAKLRREYEIAPGLSDADRKAQLDKLDRELLDLELVEESLIRSAEKVGFEVLRRFNANPLAVLAHDSVLPE